MIQLFNYIERVSPIHKLTGASKMACMLCWVLAAMITFDTRYLVLLTVFALILFRVSRKIGRASWRARGYWWRCRCGGWGEDL